VTDGRTDGQTDRFAISISRVSVLTREKNDMGVQLSLSVHFYVIYLLLSNCDGNEAEQRVYLHRLLVALKRADCAGWFVLREFVYDDTVNKGKYRKAQTATNN